VPASCALERVRVDLSDASARQALLASVGAGSKRVVVLTEGLLIYLAKPAVAALARELHAQPSIAQWMMDLVGPEVLLGSRLRWNRALAQGNAQMQFGPRGGARHFEAFGWKVRASRSFADEGARLHRGHAAVLWGRFQGLLLPPLRRRIREGAALLSLERCAE
jgi:O-methyltransferase involved in polyketide biosynthesis